MEAAMSLKLNVTLINIYTICCNMVFVLPVIVPYYSTLGLTFRDFLISEAIFSAVVLFAEVPSGWISDVWKRRTALIFGMVFGIAGYGLLMVAESFWQTAAAQGIIGIAVAMNSGTVTALLYDSLLEQDCQHEYRRLDGKRHALGLYSVAIAALVGAWCYTIHPKLTLLMEVVVMLGGMVAISFVVEPKRHMKSVEKNTLHDIKETVKYALSGHPEITGIIVVSTVIFCATKMMMWSQQPYYESVGIPVEWFGAIMAGSYLIGGTLGHWSHKIEHIRSNRFALGFIAAVLALSCLILSLILNLYLALGLFLTGTIAYGAGQPRVHSAINKRVGSERRATILSTASLMVHVLFIPTSVIVGFIVEKGSVRNGLMFLAGHIALLAGIGLWLWKGKPDQAASSSITGT
jgi:MFS family permease